MENTTLDAGVEEVTIGDVLGLASWDRPRSDDELRGFLQRRVTEIGDPLL